MKTAIAILITALCLCSVAHTEPRVSYVGDGRYACSGTQSECSPYERNNRDQEEDRKRDQTQRELLDEQRKQTKALEEMTRQNRPRNFGQ